MSDREEEERNGREMLMRSGFLWREDEQDKVRVLMVSVGEGDKRWKGGRSLWFR